MLVAALVTACGAGRSGSSPDSITVPAVTTQPATSPAQTETTIAPAPPSSAPPSTAQPAAGLDGDWVLTSGVAAGEPVTLLDEAPIRLTATGTTLSGTSACNSYEFTFVERAGGIEIVDGFVTSIGCEAPIAALEETFLRSFGPSATYTAESATLTWRTPTATWVFERVEPADPVPLVGTDWVLNGVLYEFGGMTTAGIEQARITFAADGTFSGSTGCRDVTGTWSSDATTITTIEFAVSGTCTGPLVEIDEIVVAVLTEGFSATIDGDRLTARPRQDLGLDYFAR